MLFSSSFDVFPQAVPEISIRSNVAAISMEEALPVAASSATLLAPEELYEKPKGTLRGETEITREERRAARRGKKEHHKRAVAKRDGTKHAVCARENGAHLSVVCSGEEACGAAASGSRDIGCEGGGAAAQERCQGMQQQPQLSVRCQLLTRAGRMLSRARRARRPAMSGSACRRSSARRPRARQPSRPQARSESARRRLCRASSSSERSCR